MNRECEQQGSFNGNGNKKNTQNEKVTINLSEHNVERWLGNFDTHWAQWMQEKQQLTNQNA